MLRSINYKFSKIPEKFVLLKKYRANRLTFAKKFIEDSIEPARIVFSDEKRFNLNGCDSYSTWNNVTRSRYRFRKMIRSPGVMIWGMICANGLFSFKVLHGNQNSLKYIETIKNHAIRCIKLNLGPDFIFQQDNCPCHTSRETLNFFKANNINLLDWPPYSPDINLIENVWPILSKLVYQDGHPKNIKDLIMKIELGAKIINETKREDIMNIYKSFLHRLCDLIETRGNHLNY